MKKLILFLLLTQVWALSFTKTVSGPELIDVNESLSVSIDITASEGVYIEKIEDEIPIHFIAINYPSSCEQTEKKLVCNFGQEIQGTVSIDYDISSLGVGYGLFSSPRLYYDGGVKTIDFFKQYFIGKPKILMDLLGPTTLLPDEEIIITLALNNPGTKAVESADIAINYGNKTKTTKVSLNPGESLREVYSLGLAEKTGSMDITAQVTWLNTSLRENLLVVFISPSVSIERDVGVKWLAESGKLTGYVLVKYKASNNGTAPGNITLTSGDVYLVGPGETNVIEKYYIGKAPAEKISIIDSRGVSYGIFSFEEESPKMKKDFFVLLYENVAGDLPSFILIAVVLGALYFSKKLPSPNLKAGFLLIALISILLLYSQYHVGALKLPGFGPKPVIDSILNQLPQNLSG
ncbi:MAG: hypothetical protein GOU98_01560 [Candidatus Altiarchaeota archaeon]|nr:hypothetical protein [Candidatus Altiarchaeota archaeon]